MESRRNPELDGVKAFPKFEEDLRRWPLLMMSQSRSREKAAEVLQIQ